MNKLKKYKSKIKTLINIDFIILFLKNIYQKSKNNNIFTQAMAMVYITTLSIVPFLIFTFYIMNVFNFFGKIDIIIEEIKNLIINNLAAGPGEELLNFLQLYILNADLEQLGIISFISLIFIIVIMLARIEITFNKIWNVKKHRDLFKRFVSFWTFITLGTFFVTLILALSLIFTERYLGFWLSGEQISQSSILDHIFFTFNFLIFIMAYYFIPNTKVKPSAALLAGTISGFLFISLKRLYAFYTSNIVSYGQIYGSLSIIPIFLLWLYLIWLIILIGAIISYLFQHRSSLQYMLNRNSLNSDLNNLTQIAILISLYKNYNIKTTEIADFEFLVKKINLPAEEIKKAIEDLKNKKLITESKNENYIILNKVEKISVWDIYSQENLRKGIKIDKIFKEKEMKPLYQKISKYKKDKLSTMKISDFIN